LFSDQNGDIEAARQHLELLFQGAKEEKQGPPLLSSIARERRETEIELLRQLESEDVTGDLWTLWYGERGPAAALELRELEQLMGNVSKWAAVEERLQSMIDEYGVFFVEPVNRLATLCFLQGRYQESKKLCQVVLEQKPWHFGALSGIVMVHVNLKEMTEARQWAARRLPSLASPERRKEWVERAVEDARKSLLEEEKRLRMAFGRK
jgi:hypothetical protein